MAVVSNRQGGGLTSPIGAPAPRSSTTTRVARLAAAAAVAALTSVSLVACAGEPDPGRSPAPTTSPVEIPATPVGERARWVLEEINGDEQTTTDEITSRFDEAALAELTAEGLQQVFDQMQAAAPWSAVAYDGAETQARVTLESAVLASADDAASVANPSVALGWARDAAAILTAP